MKERDRKRDRMTETDRKGQKERDTKKETERKDRKNETDRKGQKER